MSALRTGIKARDRKAGPVTIIVGPIADHDAGRRGGQSTGRPAAPIREVLSVRAMAAAAERNGTGAAPLMLARDGERFPGVYRASAGDVAYVQHGTTWYATPAALGAAGYSIETL